MAEPIMIEWPTCASCGESFESFDQAQRYCSRRCRSAGGRRRLVNSRKLGIGPSTIGTISELRVCADLLARGYCVFRAVSPHCPWDLLVCLPDGPIQKVEVKTGYYGSSGKITYATPRKDQVFDLLAVALPERIVYDPPLE